MSTFDDQAWLREEVEARAALGVFLAEVESSEDQFFSDEREEYEKIKKENGAREAWEYAVRKFAEHARDAAKIFGAVYFGEKP